MSLISALFNVGLIRRVGIWGLIQALPDEQALHGYLQALYKGIAVVIIGSLLTGAAVTVGLIATYNLMLKNGMSELAAVGITAVSTVAIILTCFALAGRWILHAASIKDDLSLTKTKKGAFSLTGIVGEAVSSVAEGFVEGLTSKPAVKSVPPARRIRLIQS